MILIADSGSTKTEWCLVAETGTTQTLVTPGINPFYQDSENISAILKEKFNGELEIETIYFYGAGCINEEKKNAVRVALLEVFKTDNIFIGSDLLGAAHSLCQDQSGIACIMGTGSNSCFYNGHEIILNVSPLGYVLGDEGSGAVLGKKLIGDVLKKQLPEGIINEFFETYHTTGAEILENVYKKPFPNRYLAGFAKFLSKKIEHPEIENIVLSAFREFVTRNLLQYPGIGQMPIHFTGSVAFHFEAQLRKVIQEHNLITGNIENAPMKGLINYHNRNVII